MARVGIKRDKDGVYDDKNCISKVKGPDYQPKGASGPASPGPAQRAGHTADIGWAGIVRRRRTVALGTCN